MSLLMKRIEEVEELRKRYNLKSYEIFTLHLLAIREEKNLSYEEMKKSIINKNKNENKDYTHLFD